MNKLIYKKGYLLRIASWENDLDHFNTVEINVADEARARTIAKFAQLFQRDDVGNIYDPDEEEMEDIKNIFFDFYQNNLNLFPETWDDIDATTDANAVLDAAMEFASELGLTGDEYWSRAASTVEIYYFENDVYCQDVSDDFK